MAIKLIEGSHTEIPRELQEVMLIKHFKLGSLENLYNTPKIHVDWMKELMNIEAEKSSHESKNLPKTPKR